MMKLLFTILSLTAIKANATTYYVSNAGSDAANGTSTATSWQTISKINSFAFALNDSILFKRGDTWNEQLTVNRTYLNFSAYGTGSNPIITGFQTVTGFSQSGNVWTATASNAVNQLNCVLLNGGFAIKARTPNTGYSLFTSWVADSIINTPETGTPSRVGKEIVVRSSTYIIDICNVKSQSTGQLTLFPKTTVNLGNFGRGYFFQNDASFVDTTNEYSFDSTSKTLKVYSTVSPTVLASVFDTLVKIRRGSTFRNIRLTGANKLLLHIDTSTAVSNCSFQYAGNNAIEGDTIRDVLIDSSSISDVWNDGINIDFTVQGHKITITNNDIRRIGTAAGMGKSFVGSYTGIIYFADSSLVEYNAEDSLGYIGIHFEKGTIKHNYVQHACLIKVDCGSIYTFGGTAGNLIEGNIVGNNPGNPDGITGNNIANGIYIDDNSTGQTVNGNTAFNCLWSTCFVHVALSNNIFTNNLFDDSISRPFFNNGTPNLTSKYNTFYSRNPTIEPYYSDNNTGQTTDSNWYLRPTAAFTYPTDTHAFYMPTLANTNIAGTLFINPTKSDSTITFNQAKTYVDKYNRLYAGTMVLHPYQSIELFESTLGMVKSIKINGIR